MCANYETVTDFNRLVQKFVMRRAPGALGAAGWWRCDWLRHAV
mgnify:CR=1 FL=1